MSHLFRDSCTNLVLENILLVSMGNLNVKVIKTQKQLNDFTRCLLRDYHLLEQMIEKDWFETGQMHIGAEQEFCLIDKHYKPATRASDVLQKLNHPSFTTELGQFNIEANLAPQAFKEDCFAKLDGELNMLLTKLNSVCQEMGIDYLLTGILPTLRKFDLSLDNITPLERYYALNEAISKMRGKPFELHLKGYDEINLKLDSVMLEACNTSFQVHLQVRPDEFVEQYNIAQLLAGPTVAVGSNSPMLFGKRLWHETRIALFQKSVDTRITNEHIRDRSPRVTFGNSWLKNSVLDLFKEDIELKELYHLISSLLTEGYQQTIIVDLHATSADNGSFIVNAGMPAQDSVVKSLRLPIVMNLDDYIHGTLLRYFKGPSVTAFAFEGGQIGLDKTAEVHTYGLWQLMTESGLIDEQHDLSMILHYQELIGSMKKGQPNILRVLHRHEVKPQDYFHMKPGFDSFQFIEKGELLAEDKSGAITSPIDGRIFMPLYQIAGDDGFFIVEEV